MAAADRPLLEWIASHAAGSVHPPVIADALLAAFGDLPAVISASTVELFEIEGVDEELVTAIQAVQEIAQRVSHPQPRLPETLNDPREIEAYLLARFAGVEDERLLLIFLNSHGVVLGDETTGT
jgi:DNA repair protein RadC